jgi:hypothetical protein
MGKEKRPRDPNQLAKFIADVATGEVVSPKPEAGKNQNAVELGRMGGLKGGKARAEKLTPEQRKKIAADAAKKRWSK